MKSIHFNQVPNVKGKKTMPFTDVTAFNAKEKYNERFDMKLAQMEISELVWDEDEICDVWYDWEKMYDD